MQKLSHKPLFFLLLIIEVSCSVSCGQKEIQERFKDKTFTNISITKDIEYCTATRIGDSVATPLYFDFYEPALDTMAQRPLVITIFGGAYVVGNRHWSDMVAIADSLAHHGYAVASIDYRLIPIKEMSKNNMIRGGYMAAQDLSTAIRFFKAHARQFRIDPDRIFLIGNSAGSISALYVLYVDDDERPTETRLEPDLGNIDASGPIELKKYSSTVAGVISQWGGITDLSIIDADEKTPVCLIHGTNDLEIPYDRGKSPLLKLVAPYLYGSQAISMRLDTLHIPHELHPFKGEGHAFYFLPDQIHLVQTKLDANLQIMFDFLSQNNTTTIIPKSKSKK